MLKLIVDYPQLVRAILLYFTGQQNCEVHLISHVHHLTNHINTGALSPDNDYPISQLLTEEFPQAILAPRFDTPSSAKSYIAAMDFFCGSRMHACIAAFSSGVPVVPIAYSRKFTGLFQSLGYQHIADCRKETSRQILNKVIKGFEEREMLRTLIEVSILKANEKLTLYEALLKTYLTEAGKKRR
jgi:polysaccharide pyruvyl transferase WcaK-like protein